MAAGNELDMGDVAEVTDDAQFMTNGLVELGMETAPLPLEPVETWASTEAA